MTRFDPVAPTLTTFDEAVDWSQVMLQHVRKVLASFLVPLTDDELEHLPPVPDELPEAADAMLAQKELLARFSTVCPSFDPARVRSDLRLAATVGPLLAEIENVSRLVSGGQRSHLARAFTAILPIYNTARDLGEKDATWLPLVRPLAKVYATRSATRKANAKAKAVASTPTASED